MVTVTRYQAISLKTGKVIATGEHLYDVEGVGERIIVDYKLKRHAIEGRYPGSSKFWDCTPWIQQQDKISKILHSI